MTHQQHQQQQQQPQQQQPAQASSKAMVRGGDRTEQQLARIVAMGASVRESAWEGAQAQLARLRFERRSAISAQEVSHA